MTDYSGILVNRSDDHVATITINRPAAMNSFAGYVSGFPARLAGDRRRLGCTRSLLRASPGCLLTGRTYARRRVCPFGPRVGHARSWPSGWDQAEQMLEARDCRRGWMCAGGAFYGSMSATLSICSKMHSFFDPHVTSQVSALRAMEMRWRIPPVKCFASRCWEDERICAAIGASFLAGQRGGERRNVCGASTPDRRPSPAKPAVAVQGNGARHLGTLDMSRSIGIQNGVSTPNWYSQATARVDPEAIMRPSKTFEVR